MRRTAWALLAVFWLMTASGLAADDQPRFAPPPARTEARTLQPSPTHIWISGYWKWAGINYEWVEGRWIKGKKDKLWVPGTWEQTGAHWTWKPGKWAKPEKDKKVKPGKKPKDDKKAPQPAAFC
jgi:hypothetical protein